MTRKHASLKDDYKSENGEYRDKCIDVASEMAKRLEAEGKSPIIISGSLLSKPPHLCGG